MKKRNKRVLHLLPSNRFSGAENVVCTIIENNNQCDMFYCSPKGPIETTLKEKNINYIPLNKFNIKSVKKVISEYDIDIIHAHDFKASFLAAFTGFKGKIISHLHNNPPFIKKWNLYTLAYYFVAKKFYKVAVVSKAVYEESVFKRKIADKFFVVNNVVNYEKILKFSKEKYDNKFDIAFIGRITDQKDPMCFIEVIKKLKEYFPDIKATMIGTGDLSKKCEELITGYGLSDNIDMVGFNSNPYKILKNSKVVLMPSKYEGFGLTAIESMCLSKPLLNSGKGGLETIFKNHKEFICSSENDYVFLCKLLLSDEKEYRKYSNACKEIIKPYIQIDSWMNSIYSLYE